MYHEDNKTKDNYNTGHADRGYGVLRLDAHDLPVGRQRHHLFGRIQEPEVLHGPV